MTGSVRRGPEVTERAAWRPSAGRPPAIAFLSYSSGQFDARSMRMARSALAAGWHVTMYARLDPGQPAVEERDGYRVIRVPADWRAGIPLVRRTARRGTAADPSARRAAPAGGGGRGVLGAIRRRLGRWRRLVLSFPLRPLGWAAALDRVVEPADIWHGLWAGSLPALQRVRARHGGRTIYDSRDVFMLSREWARLGWPLRPLVATLERRWARRVDQVITVNEPYADVLARQLGVARPPVVMNCPETWWPPSPPPDRIRAVLGVGPETAIALHQGQLISERGIEETIVAILGVPGAILALLGYGPLVDEIRRLAAAPPYLGKVHLLPPVPPDELLEWTASADVSVVAIQPTTINHRFSTPQKLFESIAVGIPVVASDLPGIRQIVASAGLGRLCDPTSPDAIAAALREILEAPAESRAELRARVLEAAHAVYNWETQAKVLFDVYESLLSRHPTELDDATG